MLGCSHLKGQGGPGSSTFYLGQGQKYTLALPLFMEKNGPKNRSFAPLYSKWLGPWYEAIVVTFVEFHSEVDKIQ